MPEVASRALRLSLRPHRGTREYPGGQVDIIRAAMAWPVTVAAFGRGSGKSPTALFLFLHEGATVPALYTFAYCAPKNAETRRVYELWKRVLRPLLDTRYANGRGHLDTQMILWIRPFGANQGAVIHFYGLDEYDNIRGPRFYRIVVDEVKDVAPEAITNVLMPMRLGREGYGGVLLMGTPSRQGLGAVYFEQEYIKGQDPLSTTHYSLGAPSYCNPFLSQTEIATYIAACSSESAIQEEIWARFLPGEGQVFENLDAVFTVPLLREEGPLWIAEDPDQGDEDRVPDSYVIGFDIGRLNDPSVASVFNRRTRRQAALLRMKGAAQDYQRQQLASLRTRYNGAHVYYDDTGGYGWAVVGDMAAKEQMGFIGRTWTQNQKEDDITRGRFLCQNAGTEAGGRGWYLMDLPFQRGEFKSYQAVTRTKDGRPLQRAVYGAPTDMHDDTVAAACLVSEPLSAPYVPTKPREWPPAFGTLEWFLKQRRRGPNGQTRDFAANIPTSQRGRGR